MGDRDDPTAQLPETLEVGNSRPPAGRPPARWWRDSAAILVLLVGVALGAVAVLVWQDRAGSPPPADSDDQRSQPFDEHAVELILLRTVPPETPQGKAAAETDELHVAGAILLSGIVTSTVWEINDTSHGLDVRSPSLPVTVTPATRYQFLTLRIVVRDCKKATRWRPAAGTRPFTVAWRDEGGKEHLDRAGDFDLPVATSFAHHIAAECTSNR